jgi:hypothetical protein
MSEQQAPASSEQIAGRRRFGWRRVAAVFVAALVVTSAAVGYLLYRGDKKEPAVAAPTSFSINGTIVVEAGDASEAENDGDCVTDGGYTDIRLGAQVTVKDEAGNVIALGKVDAGRTTKLQTLPTFDPDTALTEDQAKATECSFGFSATAVPEGKQFYAVEIARRGEVRYQRADLSKSLDLTLGG